MLRRIGVVAVAGAASLAVSDARAASSLLGTVTDSTIVTFDDNQGTNTFQVSMETTDYKTWCYTVTELAGKDLSNWLLEICVPVQNLITSYTPGAEIGYDGSSGLSGIKWNVEDSFTTGTFCFTLSEARAPEELLTVVMKAGPNSGTSTITGPSCEETPPVIPLPPAVWMGSVLVGGMVARRALRRRA